MRINRQLLVVDAPALAAESAFWAGVLGGTVETGDGWHTVVVDGEWRLGIQFAPDLVPADWPNGTPQQMHLDLFIDDPQAAHDEVMGLGARLLQPADDLSAAQASRCTPTRPAIRSASAGADPESRPSGRRGPPTGPLLPAGH